jgi:hypothetical protein
MELILPGRNDWKRFQLEILPTHVGIMAYLIDWHYVNITVSQAAQAHPADPARAAPRRVARIAHSPRGEFGTSTNGVLIDWPTLVCAILPSSLESLNHVSIPYQ